MRIRARTTIHLGRFPVGTIVEVDPHDPAMAPYFAKDALVPLEPVPPPEPSAEDSEAAGDEPDGPADDPSGEVPGELLDAPEPSGE